MSEPKLMRDRAAVLCNKHWHKEFSRNPQLKELVIDLMESFAQKELMRDYTVRHNQDSRTVTEEHYE